MFQRFKLGAARQAYAAFLLGFIWLALAGCNAQSKMSKDEEKNFKGGPMPANFKPNVSSGAAAGGPPSR